MRTIHALCIAALIVTSSGAREAYAQAGRWGLAPPPSASEREPREPRSWERDEPAAPASLESASRSSGVTPWSAPPQRDPATGRCEHFREQMEEAIRAEMRGADRSAERQAIYQASRQAGC